MEILTTINPAPIVSEITKEGPLVSFMLLVILMQSAVIVFLGIKWFDMLEKVLKAFDRNTDVQAENIKVQVEMKEVAREAIQRNK